jgi:anti-sigma factor RsiW
MTDERQWELQAYADGELSASARRKVEARLATDAGARALLAELQMVRQALGANEPMPQLPESREFYWSKIEQEINRLESVGEHRAPSPVLQWWRRLILPAAGLAVLALTFGVTVFPKMGRGGSSVEASFPGTEALTYRDQAHGVTLVWLSYPSEEEPKDYEAPPQDDDWL